MENNLKVDKGTLPRRVFFITISKNGKIVAKNKLLIV